MDPVFYLMNYSFQSHQRPCGDPDASSRLEINTWFSQAERHSFPEWLHLTIGYDSRNTFEGDQRYHTGKCQDPESFCEGHPDEDVRRKQRQEHLRATACPAPLHSVHWEESANAAVLALLGHMFFVAAAGIGDIPMFRSQRIAGIAIHSL